MSFIINLPASDNEYGYRFPAAFCKSVFLTANYKTEVINVTSECFGDNTANWMNTSPVITMNHTLNLNLFGCLNIEEIEQYIKEYYYPDAVPGDEDSIYGCTDPEAYNYNPDATVDDGTCVGTGTDGDHYHTWNPCECTPNYEDIVPLRMDDAGHDYFISSQGGEAGQFYCVGTNTDQPICGVIKDHGYAVEIPENYYPLEELIPYLETQGVSGPYFDQDPLDGCQVCCATQYPTEEVILTLTQQENAADYIATITSADETIYVGNNFTFAFTTEIINLIGAFPGALVNNEEQFNFMTTPGPMGTIVCNSIDGESTFNIQTTPGELFTFTIANGDIPPLLLDNQVSSTVSFNDIVYEVGVNIVGYEPPPDGLAIFTGIYDSYGDGGETAMITHANINYMINEDGNLELPEPWTLPLSSAEPPPEGENFNHMLLVAGGTQLTCGEGCSQQLGTFVIPEELFDGTSKLFAASTLNDSWPQEAGVSYTMPDGVQLCAGAYNNPEEPLCENLVISEFIGEEWGHFWFLISPEGTIEKVWQNDDDGTLFYPNEE